MNGAKGDRHGGGDEANDVVRHGEVGRWHGNEKRFRVNANRKRLGAVEEERREGGGGGDGGRRDLSAGMQDGGQNAGRNVKPVVRVGRISRPLEEGAEKEREMDNTQLPL